MLKKIVWVSFMMLLISGMIMSACSPAPAAQPAEVEPTAEVSSVEEPAATEAAVEAPTEAPAEAPAEASATGGTFTWAVAYDVATLDPHRTVGHIEAKAEDWLGAGLVYRDDEGNYTPWLAESWTASEDGLTWEFKLREDVFFHNGDPLTAHDYAWTFNRMIAPETASPIAATAVMGLANAEAVDDYTLKLNFGMSNASLLFNMASNPGLLQPLPQAAFEEMGADAFGHMPIGVGPYKMKEFLTGDRFVLERNPDYAWGPAALENSGAYYIDTIVFRIIPEMDTIVAALEAGEVDYAWLNPREYVMLQGVEGLSFFEQLEKGTGLTLAMNVQKAPFTDLNVRKAFNYAIDRQKLVDLIAQGYGEILYGPLTPSTEGYWPGVEEIGYGYDLEAAKAAMQEAGFTYDDDGMLVTPEGEPFAITLMTNPATTWTQASEVIQSQLRELGVDVTLESQESAVYKAAQINGEYDISLSNWPYNEAGIMLVYSSMMAGVMNYNQISDPDLDMYAGGILTVLDPQTRAGAIMAAQQLLVEKAYLVPIYATYEIYAYNDRVQGIRYDSTLKAPDLSSATIVE
jgi:peptide/nickel transport system substrate-binding protein